MKTKPLPPFPTRQAERHAMKTKFTKAQLLALNPCPDGLVFAEQHRFDFAAIYDHCERGDWLIWLLRKSGNMDKPQAVVVAITCAEHVQKHNDDDRPRKAIEAAKKWLANPCEETMWAASDAANAAANAAATDAYAEFSAAYAAADAAAAAAAAATDDAAATTFDAAYAAARAPVCDAARAAERKWQADRIREMIPNPFR